MSRRTIRLPDYIFLAPYTLAFCSFIVLPFIVALVLAFVKLDLTSTQPPEFVGFDNFREALHDAYFWKAALATLTFVVMSVPSTILVALLLALGMHAMTNGRNGVRALLFLPGMLNVAVAGILWQWFYNGEFGLFAHLLSKVGLDPVPFLSDRNLVWPAIVVMTLWWTIGGSAVIFLAALQQIPTQLFEAAQIDGAGAWRRFWSITLPSIQPVMLFITVITTIGAFQVFGQPYLLTRGGPELATRGVVQYIYETAFNNYRLGYGAAMSWLLFLIIAVFALLQYRVLRKGNS